MGWCGGRYLIFDIRYSMWDVGCGMWDARYCGEGGGGGASVS